MVSDRQEMMDRGRWTNLWTSWLGIWIACWITGGLVLSLTGVGMTQPAGFVYVNNGASRNSISAFQVGPDGSLDALPGSPFETGGIVGPVNNFSNATIQVGGDLVVACNVFNHTVSAFLVRDDGTLTRGDGSPVATGGLIPVAVAADRQGARVYLAHYASNTIGVFRVGPDGALTPIAGSPFGTLPLRRPASLALTSDGSRLVVSGLDGIGVYRVEAGGSIVSAGPPLASDIEPQAVVLTPNDQFLYASSAVQSTIGGWKLSGEELMALPGSPTPLAAGVTTLGLAVNPRGNLLFATTSGEDGIHVFRIGRDGQLRESGGSAVTVAGSGLGPIGVDPTGGFLYAIGMLTRDIHVYEINSTFARISEISGSPFTTGVTSGRPSGLALK